ncbi:MAG: Fe-S cluster assembly scaffold protein NifU [Synergistaceae bacterium]|jgi:nitrogen fixation NifU-like protein|nr:Fe-S cluster assembly scaffold protein NifU [Synergistaceae bacterium]
MTYSEKVMEHFSNPRNVGEIKNPDGLGEAGNPQCGDIMKIYLKVRDDAGGSAVIEDVKFKTFGCASAIASSSMATEMIKGKTVDEAWELTNTAVAEALDGLPPIKMHCSVLAEEAIHRALSDYREKRGLAAVPIREHDHEHEAV